MNSNKFSKRLLTRLRKRIMTVNNLSKSAHVGSALSCLELLYCSYFIKINKIIPVHKIILSKGHAALALYVVLEYFYEIENKLLNNYLKNGSKYWGHPSVYNNPSLIDWSTGSLGHGLPIGCGFAYSLIKLKYQEKLVIVIMSDGECNEGSVWESIFYAGHHKLNNIVVLLDYNKIQSFGFCKNILNPEPLIEKWKSFQWDVSEVNGHNINDILSNIKIGKKPLCLICNTVKGKGLPENEGTLLSHYKPITDSQLKKI
jgi:transketolase